jgi:cyanoexosortase A
MKSLPLPAIADLKTNQFWLLGLAACLIGIHFTLTEQANSSDFLGLSILVWFAIGSLINRKRHTLKLNSDLPSTLLGGLLIAIVLLRSANAVVNPGLTLIPLISGMGLALLASGFKGLGQYWREMIMLGLLAIPAELGIGILNIANPLALVITKLVGFSLWYLGFQVSTQGNHLYLPTGGIIINDVCAGVNNLTYLFKVSIIFLLLFPVSGWKKRLSVPLVALILAFVMNISRVAILAVLSPSDPNAFKYWHEGEGSLTFTLIIVILFGTYYLFLLRREKTLS